MAGHDDLDICGTIIESISKRLAGDQKTVVGFDIFDTVITRIYPKEISFEMMCRAIAHRFLGSSNKHYNAVMKAYQMAYSKSSAANIDAGRDYEALTDELFEGWVSNLNAIGCALNRQALEKVILEIECLSLVSMPQTVEMLKRLKILNVKVIYISDMYLGKKLIDQILTQLGVVEYFDNGYVSSDYGILKRTGNLFPLVLQKEALEAEDLIFLGDDQLADYEKPEELGIEAYHYLFPELVAERSRILEMFEKGSSDRAAQINAILASASGPDFENLSIEQFSVAKYLGPYFASFALATVEQYKAHNYGHVLFTAREGLLLKDLTDAFDLWHSEQAPEKVYFPASRLSALAFSFGDKDFGLQDVSNLVRNGAPTLRTTLSFLRLEESKLKDFAEQIGLDGPDAPLHPDLMHWQPIHRVVEMINNLQEFREFKQTGDLFHQWMQEQGIYDGKRKLFVDLGWSGQIQESLARGFERRGVSVVLDGYYSGMRLAAHWRRRKGSDLIWYHCDQCNDDTLSKAPLWFPQIMETICRSPHGTVVGFEHDTDKSHVKAIFKTNRAEQEEADDALISRIQDLLINYSKRLAAFCALFEVKAEELRHFSSVASFKFLMCPESEIARLFSGFCNVSDLGLETTFQHNGGQGSAIFDSSRFRQLEKQSLWPTAVAASFLGEDYAKHYTKFFLARLRHNHDLKRTGGLTASNRSDLLNNDSDKCESPHSANTTAQQSWNALTEQVAERRKVLADNYQKSEICFRHGIGQSYVDKTLELEMQSLINESFPFYQDFLVAIGASEGARDGKDHQTLASEMTKVLQERDKTIADLEKMALERYSAIQEMGRFIYERDKRIRKLEKTSFIGLAGKVFRRKK